MFWGFSILGNEKNKVVKIVTFFNIWFSMCNQKRRKGWWKICTSYLIYIQLLRNFELWFNLVFSEKIIQYSTTFALQVQTSHGNQAHAPPCLSRAFQRHQEHNLKHPPFSGSHNYKTKKTKQNKLPCFIDRCENVRENILIILWKNIVNLGQNILDIKMP